MPCRSVGRVAGNFYLLGLCHYPVYLLDGPCPAFFDGGTSSVGRLYVEEARAILGEREPEYIFVTHAHWDHCGGVAHLKEAFPKMKIAAPNLSVQVLQKPSAVRLIDELSREAWHSIRLYPEIDQSRLLDGSFHSFEVDIELEDGQVFDLGGGSTVEVLATPGHTRDSHSFYLPKEKIIIAGDSAGNYTNFGNMICEFLTDYRAYLATIEKLSSLPSEVYCQGHHIAHVGHEEIRTFFEDSMRESLGFKDYVLGLLDEENGSIEGAMRRIKAEKYDVLPHPKQQEMPYIINMTARVKNLAEIRESL